LGISPSGSTAVKRISPPPRRESGHLNQHWLRDGM
jgi:hypothetical protein